MSLDIDLMVTKPCSVYSANITHNLGKMASQVHVGDPGQELTLYDVLWRPDEHKLNQAFEIIGYLSRGLETLVLFPDHYSKFNPENGWGDYDGLVHFTREYYLACLDNLEAKLEVSR